MHRLSEERIPREKQGFALFPKSIIDVFAQEVLARQSRF